MIVVSDTTAITTALKADQAGLLTLLSGTVFVPQAVWDELADRHSPLPGFIQLHQVNAPFRRPGGTESLGLGESEAIQLALELGADVLLTDDRKARSAAAVHGIRCVWLLGLAVEAKRQGKLRLVRPVMEALERAGFICRSGSKPRCCGKRAKRTLEFSSGPISRPFRPRRWTLRGPHATYGQSHERHGFFSPQIPLRPFGRRDPRGRLARRRPERGRDARP